MSSPLRHHGLSLRSRLLIVNTLTIVLVLLRWIEEQFRNILVQTASSHKQVMPIREHQLMFSESQCFLNVNIITYKKTNVKYWLTHVLNTTSIQRRFRTLLQRLSNGRCFFLLSDSTVCFSLKGSSIHGNKQLFMYRKRQIFIATDLNWERS